MIYKNVEIFNVSELTEGQYGMQTHRLPTSVEAALSEKGKEVNKSASGVEIRFRMLGDSVKLRLSLGSNAYLYRGSVLGGWQDFSHQIAGHGGSEIVIERSREITRFLPKWCASFAIMVLCRSLMWRGNVNRPVPQIFPNAPILLTAHPSPAAAFL